MTLNPQQRSQLWDVCVEEFNANPELPPRRVAARVRKRLCGFGWEQLLIQLAISVIIPWLKKWFSSRLSKAPITMPPDFGE